MVVLTELPFEDKLPNLSIMIGNFLFEFLQVQKALSKPSIFNGYSMSAALNSPHDESALSTGNLTELSEEENTHHLQCQEILKRILGPHHFYDDQHNQQAPGNRNVGIYDASEEIVACIVQIGWYRISDLYRWLRIVITTEEPFLLRQHSKDECLTISETDQNVLECGDYYVVNRTGKPIAARASFNSEDVVRRLTFPGTWDAQTEIDEEFRQRAMERDMRCCCMYVPIDLNNHIGISVIDIFPQAHAEKFIASDLASKLGVGNSRKDALECLRSPQNGLSMDTMSMIYFEGYELSIDVDDGYRIVQLGPNPDLNFGPDWRLYVDYSKPAHERPSPILLREHFRQSLMKHVLKTGGDPYTESEWREEIDEPEEGQELDGEEVNWNWFQRLLRDRDESVDLGEKIWLTPLGKDAFEQYLQKSLFGCLPEFLDGDHPESDERYSRFNKQRLQEFTEIEDPEDVEDIEWPESFPRTPPPQLAWWEQHIEHTDIDAGWPAPTNASWPNGWDSMFAAGPVVGPNSAS